jgi:hypothetical protein
MRLEGARAVLSSHTHFNFVLTPLPHDLFRLGLPQPAACIYGSIYLDPTRLPSMSLSQPMMAGDEWDFLYAKLSSYYTQSFLHASLYPCIKLHPID